MQGKSWTGIDSNRFNGNFMAKSGKAQESTFEASLERLESIVEEMESGEMPLEQIINRYEEGMKHLAVCDKKLTEAEVRIRKLTENEKGEFVETDSVPGETDAE